MSTARIGDALAPLPAVPRTDAPGAPEVRAAEEPAWIGGNKSCADVTADVCAPLERRPTALWKTGLLVSLAALALGTAAVVYQIRVGIGTWGANRTIGWAFDITNFVFWVGIGHAGTLISAVLLLLRQRWRTSINRSAEAMTLFAVACAGIFPLIHMGRPWLAYWVFPYPNQRGPLWVNFQSPLLWDVFAIGTYFTISAVFWYVGLLPDLATVRERCSGLRRRIFGLLSLGWDGSGRTWSRWEMACLLLAGLAAPLVVSVHSVVSMDFATSVIPGWHATVFPPYFVIGAVFSGFAMVLTLMLVARRVMRLQDYITRRHVSAMCKVLVFTGGIVGVTYAVEFFVAWYSGNAYERFAFANRVLGPLGWAWGVMAVCNVLVPQLLWFRAVRSHLGLVFAISLLVNVGMWFERYVIIVGSLSRDFLPSSWSSYVPTVIEGLILLGSFGLFFAAFLLFCRFLPMIAMAEVRAVVVDEQPGSAAVRPAPSPVSPVRGADGRTRYCAEVPTQAALLAAAREAPRSGLRVVEAYSPHPVHGLDAALRRPRSRLPWVTLAGGSAGFLLMLAFQHWTSAVDWPLDVGGKPVGGQPAYVPVAFELLVLCAGLLTAAAFLWRSRLLPGRRPWTPAGVTDDRYVLVLESDGAAADPRAVADFLARHGARPSPSEPGR